MMEDNISDGMCRCCASEGSFKDFQTTYHWMGVEEIYSDMLKDCFNISLASSEAMNNGGICEVCVTQLRNAFNFKRQVQLTEEQFKKKVRESVFKSGTIKLEMSQEDVESDNVASDNLSDADYEVPIKEEKLEDKPKKRQAKASTSKAKKPKTEGETSKRTRKKRKSTVVEESADPNNVTYREKHLREIEKQAHNLLTILKYSNATPFKERNDAGYMCAYCFKSFPDPNNLRQHTRYDHISEKRTYKACTIISNFVACLDIVDLKCTICEMSMDSIKVLSEHLVNEHDKIFYKSVRDYFQPFKLTKEQQIQCCLCNKGFHNMRLLMQHMNVHFRNFICTTCGAGFVNKYRLSRHEKSHLKKKSVFACRHCGQVFDAESKKKTHVNTEHKGIEGHSICQICKARFKNYYQKTRHMMQVHKKEGIKCDMCEKRFNLNANLMLHMRGVHLNERPYECTVCSMGFLTNRHMLTHYIAAHTNERKYKCDMCSKAYAIQNSLRKHINTIHGKTKKIMTEQNIVK